MSVEKARQTRHRKGSATEISAILKQILQKHS